VGRGEVGREQLAARDTLRQRPTQVRVDGFGMQRHADRFLLSGLVLASVLTSMLGAAFDAR